MSDSILQVDTCLCGTSFKSAVHDIQASLHFTATALFISGIHLFHYIIPRAKQASSILTHSLKHKCYPVQGHLGTRAQRSGHR